MKHIIPTLSLTALLLSSCTTINPETGQRELTNLTKGTGLGAAAGAALGLAIGDSTSATLKGAAAGALAGGAIGNYMDIQEIKMKQALQGTDVSVTRDGDNLLLNLPSDITFQSGSPRLEPKFDDTLGSVAKILEANYKTQINIIGHTDSDGSDAFNRGLSVNRARSVAGYLAAKGITQNRLITSGLGEFSPIADNNTEAGKAQNRRVEMRIVPLQDQF